MGSSPIRVATRYASVAQLVEQGTENPRVVGSIPTGGTISADLAHLVERHLAKVEVAGSSPVIRSKRKKPVLATGFFLLEAPYGNCAAPSGAKPCQNRPRGFGRDNRAKKRGNLCNHAP